LSVTVWGNAFVENGNENGLIQGKMPETIEHFVRLPQHLETIYLRNLFVLLCQLKYNGNDMSVSEYFPSFFFYILRKVLYLNCPHGVARICLVRQTNSISLILVQLFGKSIELFAANGYWIAS